MDVEHILTFGTYKGKTLKEVAQLSPSYILWLAGVTTKYSLKKESQELYAVICKDHPDDVNAIKDFVKGKCYQCWTAVSTEKPPKHFCDGMKIKTFHHYHPYGKKI